jgi:hypothetical protein
MQVTTSNLGLLGSQYHFQEAHCLASGTYSSFLGTMCTLRNMVLADPIHVVLADPINVQRKHVG